MTLLQYKSIAAILLLITSVVTALITLKRHAKPTSLRSANISEGLASGIFLGAAFFHMLPDSIESFQSLAFTHHYPLPETILILGFLSLLSLERLAQCRSQSHQTQLLSLALTLILTIHAITEGIALGLSNNLSETLMLFLAIIVHKSSETFALCLTLSRDQAIPTSQTRMIGLIFAFMTPIGILIGHIIHSTPSPWVHGCISAFTAGTFLYMSTLHHTHSHHGHTHTQSMSAFFSLLVGVSLMAGIAAWS